MTSYFVLRGFGFSVKDLSKRCGDGVHYIIIRLCHVFSNTDLVHF